VEWPQSPGHPDDALLHVLANCLRVVLVVDILLVDTDAHADDFVLVVDVLLVDADAHADDFVLVVDVLLVDADAHAIDFVLVVNVLLVDADAHAIDFLLNIDLVLVDSFARRLAEPDANEVSKCICDSLTGRKRISVSLKEPDRHADSSADA